MKIRVFHTIALALALFTSSSKTIAADTVHDDLKGLQRLLGTWQIKGKAPDGTEITGTFIVKVEAGGRVLSAVTSLSTGESQFGMAFVDPETKKISIVFTHSDGTTARETFTSEQWEQKDFSNTVYFKESNGKEGVGVEHFHWTDSNTFEWTFTDIILGGQKQPDSPRMTYTRKK
jgi:hypothetical protein